eukprot:jgi/Chrpa1/5180/Chrysochromulina_OHIO_Genome00017943-RA
MSEAVAEGPVVVLGATGYIGKAVVRELVQRGRPTIAFIRSSDRASFPPELEGANVVEGDPQMDADGSLKRALTGASGVISCISSRTGSPREVEQIDYGASRLAMDLLIEHGHPRASYVLLSAVCVKTPVLRLHQAKLRIERELAASGLPHAIVRPTAYFKSISAQVANVVAGQPDLACLMVDQLERAVQGENKGMGAGNIIEIGGAKTVTPFEQSQMIFAAAGVEPRYVRVPLALLDLVEGAVCSVEAALLALREALGTKTFDRALEAVANAAESTRIAKFYATADMLGPSDLMYSSEALKDFYAGAVKSAKEAYAPALFRAVGPSHTCT